MNIHVQTGTEIAVQPLIINFNAPDAPKKFVHSLHHTGFAIIAIPHGQLGLYQWQVAEAFAENRNFMDNLTYERVMESIYLKDIYKDAGIVPFGSEGRTDGQPNLLEYLHHRADLRDTPENRACGRVNFPGHPFGETWQVFNAMSRLNAQLTDWLVDELPADVDPAVHANLRHLRRQIDTKKRSVIRFLKYRDHHPQWPGLRPYVDPEDGVPVWNDRHEDACWLTLIPMQSRPGLQLLGQDGKWYDIPWVEGQSKGMIYVVVNVGDTLSAASGGQLALCRSQQLPDGTIDKLYDPLTFEGQRDADENLHMWRDGYYYQDRRLRLVRQGYYPSTTHRVLAGEGVRYSMPVFFHINGWVKVQGHWIAYDKMRGYTRNKADLREEARRNIEKSYPRAA